MHSRSIHPLHERFSRTPPAITLDEFFDLFDSLDDQARSELFDYAVDAIDPFIDPQVFGIEEPISVVLRQACKRISNRLPEEVVVRELVARVAWLLLAYSERDVSSEPTSTTAERLRQLPLFSTTESIAKPSGTLASASLYEQFCEVIVGKLLEPAERIVTEEDIVFLALAEMKGIGYWTLRKIVKNGLLAYLAEVESREEFYRILNTAGAKVSFPRSFDAEDWRSQVVERGHRFRERLAAHGIHFISHTSKYFPPLLREIDDPPLWLFVQGSIQAIHRRSVAVVGTRYPTPDGESLAALVGDCLPDFDAAIVSGLAEGIDQTMHASSVRNRVTTIAVLGTGILNNFPRGSEPLRDQIVSEGGAVITEYLPSDSYSAKNFVRRNRLQAGLAQVVVPVQWHERSGTAHTVRFAYEAKRRIVCPRLLAWSEDQHPELVAARRMGAEVYSLPEERAEFVEAIRSAGGQPCRD